MQTLPCPRGGITGLTFSPDGDMLAGVGGDGLYCWTRSRDWEQTGLREPGTECVAFHPDGLSLAFSGSYLRRHNLIVREEVRLYPLTPAHRTVPERLRISHDGEPD